MTQRAHFVGEGRGERHRRWARSGDLMANVVFFGFFFLNFVVEKVSGSPLITF